MERPVVGLPSTESNTLTALSAAFLAPARAGNAAYGLRRRRFLDLAL